MPTGLLGINDWLKARLPGAGTFAPAPDPLYQAQGQQQQAQQGALNARYGVNAAQQGVFPYTMATLAANRGVLDARANTFGPQYAVLNANRGVVGAQQTQLAGQRGFVGQQQQEVTTQQGEYQNLLNAQNNTPDQAAVATFRRYQAVKDARDRALGIAPAQEIYAKPGTLSLDGSVAPGVRVKATTQAEDVARANQENQTQRGFALKQAQLAVQMMGTDVDQAQLEAKKAGLTLDEAQMLVSQAENQAGYARLNEQGANVGVSQAENAANLASLDASQADLNVRSAARPPFANAERYVDPVTGEASWLTPAEADAKQYAYSTGLSQQRIPSQYDLSQQRQIYQTAQESGGSNLAPLSMAQLLNSYMPPSSFRAPWYTGPQSDPIKTEIVRRLIQQGYSDTQAQSAAEQLLEYELMTRKKPAEKPPAAQEQP